MRYNPNFFENLRKKDRAPGIFFQCRRPVNDAQYCTETQLFVFRPLKNFSYTKNQDSANFKI
ncbi:hypothetical protein D0P12_25805 [Salmonella enterica]|nr:hypothetical protein [Salmonella enterica]